MLALEGRPLGNYDIVRRIRVGGMGAVYEGRQRTAFDRRVAIKVILGNYAVDREMRRRFAREARTIARLHHPHILPLIEFGDERGILYLVMPFIEGGTLTSYLLRNLPDLDEVAAIYQQLLDAVEYAHDEGLIHRDIKPSNVLLEERRSGAPYVYLADFGLVRTAQQVDNEPAGVPIPLDQVPGTPQYMAPEQTVGIVTPLTDIYALGVLLYQLLTGELPYDDPDEIKVIQMHLHAPIPSPSDRDPSLPEELGEVVRTAMAKRPEDRYRNVAELRQSFLAALVGRVGTFDGDALLDDQEFVAPIDPLPVQPRIPLPLELEPQPRIQQAISPPPLRARLRNTGSVVDKQRITESVPYRPYSRRRHFTLSVLAATLVPIVLLILLIMPRLLDVSLFPSGFPLFGTPPVAVVSLTEEAKVLQDKYIVTASPSAKTPDLSTRIIPDRVAPSTASGSSTTQTTGSRIIAGTRASGILSFENNSNVPVVVQSGTIFTTTSGVAVQTTQVVEVPAAQDGQNSTISAPSVAVNPGMAGNIPAQALATNCCDGLLISNPQSFTGGVNARTIRLVTQADLNRVSGPLISALRRQASRQLQKQLKANEVMVGQPTYTTTVSTSSPVGAEADQVAVQVSISAAVVVYNSGVARHVAAQLLNNEAAQSFGSNYQLQDVLSTGLPQVVEQGQNGLVYLSVSAKGTWAYALTAQQLAQWESAIKGASPAVAIAFLNTRKGVAGVQIQLPFGADHIPSSSDQIKIVVVQR